MFGRECKLTVDQILTSKLGFVTNWELKEQIKNFYLSLVNDLEFVKDQNLNQDQHAFIYLKRKLKHELEGPGIGL